MFAPIRSEYLDLVAQAPLPAALAAADLAFDIGTGVLAAMLAHRGVGRLVATELDPRALDCARENLARLGLASRVELRAADLFPEGRAALVVCNPPWIPARASRRARRQQDARFVSFAALGLVDALLRALKASGLADPTPIQSATIPGALAGCDVIGAAATGSGKTLAFALPILRRLAEAGDAQRATWRSAARSGADAGAGRSGSPARAGVR